MFHIQGKIRDYAAATDSASVEFEGLGIIDYWFDGIKIDPAVNRGYMVHGAPVTLQVADAHRLCEAIIVGVGDTIASPVSVGPAGPVGVQSGRAYIATDGSGNGAAAVTYSPAFSAIPTLTVKVDDNHPPALSGASASGFTVSIAHGPPNSYVYFSWQAGGS